MNNLPNQELTGQLLPLLPQLTQKIKDSGLPDRESLRSLLLGIAVSEEGAVGELMLWANILVQSQQTTDDAEFDTVLDALMQRGIPNAQAHLAIVTVSTISQTAGQQRADVLIRLSRDSIDFGEMPIHGGARATLEVQGGPGRISFQSDRLAVQPQTFGPEPTTITITAKAGTDGQILWASIAFENFQSQEIIEVTGSWSALVSSVPDPINKTNGQLGFDQNPDLSNLAPHTPWTKHPDAQRNLFIKLSIILLVVACIASFLLTILKLKLVP